MNEINLKEVEQLIKTATEFRDKEKEKYQVGMLWEQGINSLESSLASLSQLQIRGVELRTAKKDNLRILRTSLMNFLELGLALGIGNRSGVQAKIKYIDAVLNEAKKLKKQPGKVQVKGKIVNPSPSNEPKQA